MKYVVGVDAGNTKTLALVADGNGAIVGVGRGGCGDIYNNPAPEGGIPEVERAVEQALLAANIDPGVLVAGAFSMAGADWPEDFAFIEAAMRARSYGQRITVVNDALGALRAGSEDGNGVVVSCGTGAATGARSPDGQVWHSSFWQEPEGGDELGIKMLRAVYRAELELDPPTALTNHVLAFFGAASVTELLHHFTARGNTKPQHVRHLARLLLDEAENGDATARQIVLVHGAALGEYAALAARRVGIEHTPFTLVLTGGVLRHPSRLLADALVDRVRATSPEARPVNSRFEPVVGAVLLALESAGITVNSAVIARLAASLPSGAFFASDASAATVEL